MSKNTNSTRANNVIACTDNYDASRKNNSQIIDEKYCDQFIELALDTGREFINTIKENARDYKVISEDKNLSSVDKALGKRKVWAADIVLTLAAGVGMLGLVWFTKRVFAS